MRKTVFAVVAMALVPFFAFGVDGTVLINQSTVTAAGGFPFRITQPGSYRLSGNLTVPDANTTAIQVAAENVTIDLNGFSIIGPVVCNGSGAPVTSCSPAGTVGRVAGVDGGINSNVTVVNGTVRGMGMFGIALGRNSLVEKVHVESNGSIGILAFGSTVSGNTVGRNFGAGISCDSCTVSGNTVRDNGFQGILASGTVTGNTVVENGNDGINAQGTVSGNTSFTNSGRGIIAFCPSSVVGNTAAFNIQTNLVTSGPGCAVANNAAP